MWLAPAGVEPVGATVRAYARRVEDIARRGFASARAYDHGRPGYAPDAVAQVAERLGLVPPAHVCDLAAGTGQLTGMLVPYAGRLTAVEPSSQMRSVVAARRPEVAVLDGEAERIPGADGAFDAVTVGEAFHWFDGPAALAEIARVLRPGGGLALLWNVTEEVDPSWPQELSRLVAEHRGASVPNEQRYATGIWRQAFERTDRFEPLSHLHATHEHELDRNGFVAQIASWSYIAALGEEARDDTLTRVRALAPERSVTRYRTDAYWTRARG